MRESSVLPPARCGSGLLGPARWLALLLLTFPLACESGEPEDRNGSGGSGGTSSATGGADAGSGGDAAAGSGNTDGSGGRSGGQGDPGTEGNGIHEQPEPYDAPPETTGRLDGAPEGSVTEGALFEGSEVYPGWKFRYWLYVPAQYTPGSPAALAVFQDGPHYLGMTEAKFNSKNTFDNLIHAGEMPVTIGLFINPGTPTGDFDFDTQNDLRSEQYDSMDDRYATFLVDEIVPAVVLEHYDIVEDPDGWAIGGHSSGGIAAFTVGWHRPDKFRKILTHNGSFVGIRGGDAYPGLVRETTPRKPLRIQLLSGTGDLTYYGGWFPANDAMADALGDAGYAFRYLRGTGGHYPPHQAVADYPDALRWLWRAYELPR